MRAQTMATLKDLTLDTVPVVVPQTALDEVVRLLDETPIRTVVLVGDGMYFGVFNDAALSASLVPAGADLALLQVGPYVHPTRPLRIEQTVEEAEAIFIHRGASALPVVSGNLYRGILTRSTLDAQSR